MDKIADGCMSFGSSPLKQPQTKGNFNKIIITVVNKICLELNRKKYDYEDIEWLASFMSVSKAAFQEMSKVLSIMPECYKERFAITSIRRNYPLVFRVLLDLGTTSNFLRPNHQIFCQGRNPYRVLTCAINNGQASIVRMLIQANADIHYREYVKISGLHSSVTPFLLAISKGYIEIAQMLQRAGADINCGSCGEGVLTLAFKALSCSHRMDKFGEVLKALLQMPGFDINARESCKTPLMNIIAFLSGEELQEEQINALRLLIQSGANPQATIFYGHGYTTLMCAVDSGHPEIVQLVLDGLKSMSNISSLSCSNASDSSDFRNPRLVKDVLDMCRFTQLYGNETAFQIAKRLGNDPYTSSKKRNNFQIISNMLLEAQRRVEF